MLTTEQIFYIVEELKEDSRIRGILLTGSYIYGVPHEQSDLDVRCISADPLHIGEKERVRFGTKVELFVDTLEKVRFYMRQSVEEGHGACVHFWTFGKIVYDPENVAAQLQKEAVDMWHKGRQDRQPWNVREEKYRKYLETI